MVPSLSLYTLCRIYSMTDGVNEAVLLKKGKKLETFEKKKYGDSQLKYNGKQPLHFLPEHF